jgi:hypothetical protein
MIIIIIIIITMLKLDIYNDDIVNKINLGNKKTNNFTKVRIESN